MNLVMMQSQLHKNRFKSDDGKTAIEVLTTANCRSVVKLLIVASWESIAKGVIVWEHYGISTSNVRL